MRQAPSQQVPAFPGNGDYRAFSHDVTVIAAMLVFQINPVRVEHFLDVFDSSSRFAY